MRPLSINANHHQRLTIGRIEFKMTINTLTAIAINTLTAIGRGGSCRHNF